MSEQGPSRPRLRTVTLPGRLPLFPLRGAILLPRAVVPLHVFEPRYIAMVDAALARGRFVGLIASRLSAEAHPPLYPVGCAGQITNFSETGDGRYMITLTGISRFRLLDDTLVDGGFRMGSVDWADFRADLVPAGIEVPELRARILAPLATYLDAKGLSADATDLENAPLEALVNSIVVSCPFDPDEKQALLEAQTLIDRAEALIALMQFGIAGAQARAGEESPSLQ